jgi:hypothetical protein
MYGYESFHRQGKKIKKNLDFYSIVTQNNLLSLKTEKKKAKRTYVLAVLKATEEKSRILILILISNQVPERRIRTRIITSRIWNVE